MNIKQEEKNKGFVCINCKKWVPVNKYNQTVNRNHCPHCLWSKHVDSDVAGDRMSFCNSGMKPIGLTSKTPRIDKWGMSVKGEVMLVHECIKCGKISINRIHAQDDSQEIMNVFENGISLSPEKKDSLRQRDIVLLEETNREEVRKSILGE